ncbi:hypothetical protein BGLT_02224 [Caballeronia glathei]|nr:hypothetical protein BGLT_02224 [Caballeronia glathei]
MPLEVARLRRSKAWLVAKRTPALAFYMINLWTASWHDKPAASLEDDDDVLADLAMCDPHKWTKLRADVLHGWVKCTDGRLYHPVVAEKALDAWNSKLDQRWKTECARIKKHNDRHGTKIPRPTFDEWMSQGCPSGQRLPVPRDNSGTDSGQVGETPSKREGEGEGQRESLKTTVPTGTGAEAPSGMSSQESIFRIGVPWLVSHAGTNVKESNIRSMLGGAVKQLGDDGAWAVVQDCMRETPIEPVAWIAAAINARIPAGKGKGKQSRHSGFDKIDYRDGVNDDGSF